MVNLFTATCLRPPVGNGLSIAGAQQLTRDMPAHHMHVPALSIAPVHVPALVAPLHNVLV